MQSPSRTTLRNRPTRAHRRHTIEREQVTVGVWRLRPPGRQPTPDEVVTRVNSGRITFEAGDAWMDILAQPRLKGPRQATFSVPIAVQVTADTSPATAMAYLDDTVTKAIAQMAWTSAADSPDGHAIDPPHPPGRPPEFSHSTVHADLRLTVTVPAYLRYRFQSTARDLLQQDVQQLCQLGIQVGAARRHKNNDQTDDDWSLRCGDDADIHDFETDVDDTFDDLDPAHYIDHPLYDEADLYDLDPAEQTVSGS